MAVFQRQKGQPFTKEPLLLPEDQERIAKSTARPRWRARAASCFRIGNQKEGRQGEFRNASTTRQGQHPP
ncbi:hypothetical protein VXQ18_03510 [Brucella abortus]|nr:hypothetical protein [Brucella abortus]